MPVDWVRGGEIVLAHPDQRYPSIIRIKKVCKSPKWPYKDFASALLPLQFFFQVSYHQDEFANILFGFL